MPFHKIIQKKIYYITINNEIVEDTNLHRLQTLFDNAIDEGHEVSEIKYREETQRLKV